MSTDINNDSPDDFNSDFHYGVFKPGVRVRQPLREGDTRLLVMPAFGDKSDPLSWVPYRNADAKLDDNGNHLFTTWIKPYYAYQFVGKKAHFLAPKTYDSEAPDPIARLLEVAGRDPAYYDILGLGPNGKKNTEDKEAYKRVLLQKAEELFAVNAVCLNPSKEEDAGLTCIYSLKKTMIRGKHDVKETGLLAALRLQNRNVRGVVDPADFANYYFWGDITDMEKLIPCRISKVQVKSTSGAKSFPYFSMLPDPDANPVRGTRAMLENRVPLTDIFNEDVDVTDTLERLIDIFSDYPELLKRAFESKYAGVSSMLEKCGVISSSRVNQPGKNRDVDDEIPGVSNPPARSAAPAATSDLPPPASGRSFAPKAAPQASESTEELPQASGKKAPAETEAPASKSGVGTSASVNAEAEKIRQQLAELDSAAA
jgi:hypothetical protein